ncbi:MAG: nucleoside diphosphate kinase regulator [Gammaproteobacteria bacterium]|nr:nucleoside diphosphate kinase regulator [Gammaproteobacteria bacterium]
MSTRPNIILSTTDAARLERLLDALHETEFPGKADLEAEISRAIVMDAKDIPPKVVTMRSTVKFRIDPSAEERCLTLVYPNEVDESGQTVSILAPVGSALLGLSEGDEIDWPKPGGGTLRVRLDEVTYQPERAGQYHR